MNSTPRPGDMREVYDKIVDGNKKYLEMKRSAEEAAAGHKEPAEGEGDRSKSGECKLSDQT